MTDVPGKVVKSHQGIHEKPQKFQFTLSYPTWTGPRATNFAKLGLEVA